jgi:tight adherence protein B
MSPASIRSQVVPSIQFPVAHWGRATSPLGIALIALALSLASTLVIMRHRRACAGARLRSLAERRGHHTPDRGALRLAAFRPKVSLTRPRANWLEAFPRRRARQNLATALAPYRARPVLREAAAEEPWALLTIPWLKQFSLAIEDLAGRSRPGRWAASMLERSGTRVRTGEVLSIWLFASVILITFAWALAGTIGSVLALFLLVTFPPAALQTAVDHRGRLFAAQLPDVLTLTASSLRAGFSLLQGLEAVTKQLREPSAGELQRVLNEARLGRPVEDALEAAAARIGNKDFSESVAAVRIQQEAGGNLASLFDTLASTMHERLRLRREVRTLTAEARLSAYVLGAMPLLLGIFLFTVDRSYMMELFQTTPGKAMLLGGAILQILGFLWMYQTVKIET